MVLGDKKQTLASFTVHHILHKIEIKEFYIATKIKNLFTIITMNKNTETIIDESGIEMLVDYRYERDEDGIHTDLISVEMVIYGTGIDILPRMNDAQQNYIIDLLTYE